MDRSEWVKAYIKEKNFNKEITEKKAAYNREYRIRMAEVKKRKAAWMAAYWARPEVKKRMAARRKRNA